MAKKKKEHWGVKVGNMFIDKMRGRLTSGVKEGRKKDWLRVEQNKKFLR